MEAMSMGKVQYLPLTEVTEFIRQVYFSGGGRSTGYGGQIPTRFMLRLTDGRIRRVYVMCYGNTGTAYVRVAGINRVLSPEVEHELLNP